MIPEYYNTSAWEKGPLRLGYTVISWLEQKFQLEQGQLK